MAFVSDNWDWMIGLSAATASLSLSRAEALHPSPDAEFKKPLREMLVHVLAGGALVMLFALLVYIHGLIIPIAAASLLGIIAWAAIVKIDLSRFYNAQLILAFIAFLFGLASWLTAF